MASTSSSNPPRGPARDPPTEPAPHTQPQEDGGLIRAVRCGKNRKDNPPTRTDSMRTGPSTSSPPGELRDDLCDPAFDEPVLPEHDYVRSARGPAFVHNGIETEAEALLLGGRLNPKKAKRPDSPVPNDTFCISEGDRKDRCEGDIGAAHPRSHFEPPLLPIHNPQPWIDVEAQHTLAGAGDGSQVKYKYPIGTDNPQKENFVPPKYHPEFVNLQEGNTSITHLRAPNEDRRHNRSKWRYSATQCFPSLGMLYPPAELQGVAQEHKEHPVFQRCTCGDVILVGEEHCTLEACIRRLMTATGLDVYEDAPAAEQLSRDFVLGHQVGLELKISRMWWRISPQEWLRQVQMQKEISKAECERRHLHIQNLRLKRDQRLELATEGTIPYGKGRGLGSLCLGSMEMAEREVVDDMPPNLAAETWETWEKVHTDIPIYDYDEPFDEDDAYYFYGVDDAEGSWCSD